MVVQVAGLKERQILSADSRKMFEGAVNVHEQATTIDIV
jgi:hypothetical protein